MYIFLVFVVTIVFGSINGSESRIARILDGQVSRITSYPYIVQLEQYDNFVCGGSIISKDVILTAAHCVTDTMKDLNIRANATLRSDANGIVRIVEKVIIHEKHTQGEYYSGLAFINDIAILKLKSPLEFGPGVAPIPMFNHNEVTPEGSFGVASGWGYVPETRMLLSNQLLSVILPIVNKTECARQYQANYYLNLERGQICAGIPHSKDTCSGDSGGPLAINGRLAGIVSAGYNCEDSYVPGIYTEVAYFRHWIADKIKQLKNSW